MITLAYAKIDNNAIEPRKATDGAAGYDLCACTAEPVVIEPRGRVLIGTGIAVALPADYAGFVFARSGLSVKHGVSLANGVGLIDSDYRGELRVGLINNSDSPYTVCNGDRIAQLCVVPVADAHFAQADELPETVRGAGGFGSTGM